MLKFLLFVILGFLAIAILPALLGKGAGPFAWALGIALMFFIIPAMSGSLLASLLGRIAGALVLAGLAGLFMFNQGRLDPGQAPTGDLGAPLSVGRLGYLAESVYDRCLDANIKTGARTNAGLATEAQVCQSQADQSVAACMPGVQSNWLILDKAGYCRDRASKAVWRPCAIRALQKYTGDNSAVLGECQSESVYTGLLRGVAGLFSGLSDPPAQTVSTPTPTYDVNCLGTAFNRNLGSMPDLQCNQYTTRVYDSSGQRTVVNDLPRFQNCLVQSILQGLGQAAGSQLVRSCQVATK